MIVGRRVVGFEELVEDRCLLIRGGARVGHLGEECDLEGIAVPAARKVVQDREVRNPCRRRSCRGGAEPSLLGADECDDSLDEGGASVRQGILDQLGKSGQVRGNGAFREADTAPALPAITG